MLHTTLRKLLSDWEDLDIAIFHLGVSLGLWGGSIEAYQNNKHVYWSNNPLGNDLTECLFKLASLRVLERGASILTYTRLSPEDRESFLLDRPEFDENKVRWNPDYIGPDRAYFVSGHDDLTQEEFDEHYKPEIDRAVREGARFLVGDSGGADTLTQAYLHLLKTRHELSLDVRVYHTLKNPRNNCGGWRTFGGPSQGMFKTDDERDVCMTRYSTHDIAWVRSGLEESGTSRNLKRRVAQPT